MATYAERFTGPSGLTRGAVPDSFALWAKESGQLNWTPGDDQGPDRAMTAKLVEMWNNEGKQIEFDKTVPDFLKNDPAWETMPQDMKEIAVYNYNLQKSQDAEKATALDTALQAAMAQADPYWKEIIRVAQDELTRGIQGLQQDEATREKELVERKKQIEQDLSYNTTYLTDQQRADMEMQLKNYDTELLGIREKSAKTGLTSSSIKTEADQQAYEKNKYTVDSMQREGQKKLRDLGVSSERDIGAIDREVEALKASLGSSATDLTRQSEKYLGTENLPTGLAPYATPLGGITGTLYEDKTKDIELRKDAIYNDLIGKSLTA